MERLRIGATDHRSKETNDNPIPSSSTQDLTNPLAVLPILPDELVNEILKRLPVKSLSRFKCVSKSWLSLISSPQFIRDHLEINRDNQRVLIKSYAGSGHSVKHCSLDCLLSDEISTDVVINDYPNLEGPLLCITIVGGFDGLVCIRANQNLFLWNPSTGKSNKLLDLGIKYDNYCAFFGFGYDVINDDYKVVAITCPLDEYGVAYEVLQFNVYGIKNESWRRVGEYQVGYTRVDVGGSGFFLYAGGIFLNGKLHWCLRKEEGEFICFFDLETESFGEIEIPKFDERCDLFFYLFQGSLCMVCWTGVEYSDVWVMKEYGVGKSWIKMLTIPIDELGMSFIYKLLKTSEDGKILLINGPNLALYNPTDSTFRYLIGLNGPFGPSEFVADACIYIESLISPTASDAADRQ
ncbi:hypothetical protein ACH5RR_032803 [Cinchona calisaya]|uniref:F-box domain-containing protein n=1 Tax=Cinchona calisaya TaxID=153742 RepID=A0ABD2YKH0_9GENT